MFNLEKTERLVIAVLISSLLAAVAVSILIKSNTRIYVKTECFGPDVAARLPDELSGNGPRVNLNEAGVYEFVGLKGVGKTLAGRIIEYRDTNGSFISTEDLKKVRGIGNALFEKIKDDIYI